MSSSTIAYNKVAVIVSWIVTVGDFLVTTIIGLFYKNYNSLTNSQSYLGTYDSPVALYMNIWEVMLGLLLLTCTWSLYKTGFFKTLMQKFALWLLAAYGIGEGIGSGLFPFNHINHELTTTGWFHSIFSGIGITAMVILSFVLIKLFPKKISYRLNKTFVLCAIAGMVFITLCLLSRKDFIGFVGLWQRLYLVAYYFMLITLTVHVSRATKTPIVAL